MTHRRVQKHDGTGRVNILCSQQKSPQGHGAPDGPVLDAHTNTHKHTERGCGSSQGARPHDPRCRGMWGAHAHTHSTKSAQEFVTANHGEAFVTRNTLRSPSTVNGLPRQPVKWASLQQQQQQQQQQQEERRNKHPSVSESINDVHTSLPSRHQRGGGARSEGQSHFDRGPACNDTTQSTPITH